MSPPSPKPQDLPPPQVQPREQGLSSCLICRESIPESVAVDLCAAYRRSEYSFRPWEKDSKMKWTKENIGKVLIYRYGGGNPERDLFRAHSIVELRDKCYTHVISHMKGVKEQMTALALIHCDDDFEKGFFRDLEQVEQHFHEVVSQQIRWP